MLKVKKYSLIINIINSMRDYPIFHNIDDWVS